MVIVPPMPIKVLNGIGAGVGSAVRCATACWQAGHWMPTTAEVEALLEAK